MKGPRGGGQGGEEGGWAGSGPHPPPGPGAGGPWKSVSRPPLGAGRFRARGPRTRAVRRRGILHQEGESEGDEADQGADVERLVDAEDKHLSHRVENDGKLIPHSGRDDRRDDLHPSVAHQLDDLVADGAIRNWQRAELRPA